MAKQFITVANMPMWSPGHPIESRGMERSPPKQIAPTHDEAHLHANTDQLANFHGHAIEDNGINAKVLIPHERLAAQLEQNTAILQRSGWLRHGPAPVLRRG